MKLDSSLVTLRAMTIFFPFADTDLRTYVFHLKFYNVLFPGNDEAKQTCRKPRWCGDKCIFFLNEALNCQ